MNAQAKLNQAIDAKMQKARDRFGRPMSRTQALIEVSQENPKLRAQAVDEANGRGGAFQAMSDFLEGDDAEQEFQAAMKELKKDGFDTPDEMAAEMEKRHPGLAKRYEEEVARK